MGTIIPNMSMKKTTSINALFSKVQQRVLGILYTQPNLVFYTNEIIRLTHSGTGAVQRELEKLAAADLVVVSQVGNQKRYQANPDSPFFKELRSIVLKSFGMADILKTALEPLLDKIFIAFIYGSIAKQEDTAKSDIDLMVIGDKLNYGDIFQFLVEPEKQLGRKINPTFYSLSDWKSKSSQGNNFINKVKKQSKIFLIGSEEKLNELK